MDQARNAFLSPKPEFGPVPFWFWNDDLDKKEITRQINAFLEKGIYGFVIHPRKGLTEKYRYLSKAYMDAVEHAVREAAKREMVVYLYDEAMYPSGAANGKVVQANPEHASKGLQMTELTGDELPEFGPGNWFVSAVCRWDGQSKSFSKLEDAISFRNSCGEACQLLLFTMVYSKGVIRGVHPGEDEDEENPPSSADLLDKAAVDSFVHITHDTYYQRLKPWFGTTVQAMFTDEPSIMGRNPIKGLVGWSHGFLQDFLACGGKEEELPLLFAPRGVDNAARRCYRIALMNRLRNTFFKTLSDWCSAHGIALTGHPASSEDIGHLQHFQLPCQDLVWRYVDPLKNGGIQGGHSTMAKCSADSARHRFKRRNGNECLGACGRPDDPWNLPFEDVKWYLDWLFVRGVNLIIPHAFFFSLRGDRGNERPPDVGMNSIWWSNYNQITDYIKRMCYLQTDCSNMADIAVLCTESCLPWEPVQQLYCNQIEFNYLEADLLAQGVLKDGALQLAGYQYRVLLVDETLPLTNKHQQMLERCREYGVQVISFAQLDTQWLKANYDPAGLRTNYPVPALRVTHTCKDGVYYYTMVNEGDEPLHFHAALPVQGQTELWDPWSGAYQSLQGQKMYPISLGYRQSLVLAVKPGDAMELTLKPAGKAGKKTRVYTGQLELEKAVCLDQIELEHNGEMARLWIDDADMGVRLWKPYTFGCSQLLQPGIHHIRVEVTEPMAFAEDPQIPIFRCSF